MARFVDPFRVNNFIDANFFDDISDGENDSVKRIVEMADSGEIQVLLPHSVKSEIEHPNTPARVRIAALAFLYSVQVQLTPTEFSGIEQLVELTKGDAQEKNIRPDLLHVAEAAKYGGYYISRDKRLLSRAAKIAELLGVEVVSPSMFLAKVAEARARQGPKGN
jgi:predicted nucleic acid-binding protein